MNARSWLRRTVTMGVLAGLAAAGVVAVGAPATADTPVVAITVSPATAIPGDTVTVTETITNDNGFTILQPRAQLFSSPDTLTGYTTLTGCDAGPGGTCDVVDGGYEAVFGGAIGGNSQATATFTLKIDPAANGGVETLAGALVAANFGSGLVPGPTLTVDARADLAVAITGTPVHSLLGLTLNFTVTVTNNGPASLRSADVTATIPLGLRATSSACTPNSRGAVCHIGALAPGHHATATFSVPVGLLDIGIPFQFSAARSASTPTDPNAANDAAADTCTVVSVLLASCVAAH
ncbi:MAG TPA: hypothetical protein VHV74_03695 [Pseudonocardiaceae bacterium]|nr:hypothetical protein [Pseudonocardiaceae bacterium]